MSEGMPDVLFSDEEVGVVALKNGDEILYTSLYWRANFAVNFLARVHYITPECDRVATVFEDIRYTPERIYLHPSRTEQSLFLSRAEFLSRGKSAHTGEQLPIAGYPMAWSLSPDRKASMPERGISIPCVTAISDSHELYP